MTLALDANRNTTMLREDEPVGGIISEGSAVSAWKRLMPAVDATTVSGKPRELNIGTLRSDILSLNRWNLMILEEGYFSLHKIKEHDGNIVTLVNELTYHNALAAFAGGFDVVVYPNLDLPLVIRPSADLEIGMTTENASVPNTIKTYAELEDGDLCILPTRQLQKIFYKSTGAVKITWGEHYVI